MILRLCFRACVACVVLVLAGAAVAQPASPQFGVASYYADDFHGKKTSNGERFDMNSMTAAHQTLPYNTLVRVTNLSNKKTVIVRINDTGPFKDNRLIDLSKAAAVTLGMIRAGTARVRLDVVETDSTSNDFYRKNNAKVDLSGWAVQVGSYASEARAAALHRIYQREKTEHLYLQQRTVKGKKVYRVVVAGFATRPAAESYLVALRKKGRTGFVFRIR